MSERAIDLMESHDIGVRLAVAKKLGELVAAVDDTWNAAGVRLWAERELEQLKEGNDGQVTDQDSLF